MKNNIIFLPDKNKNNAVHDLRLKVNWDETQYW